LADPALPPRAAGDNNAANRRSAGSQSLLRAAPESGSGRLLAPGASKAELGVAGPPLSRIRPSALASEDGAPGVRHCPAIEPTG